MKDGKGYFGNAVVTVLLCLGLVLSAAAFGSGAFQDQKVDLKVLEQISGNYEFEYQGQFMVFAFTVEDGKLMGAPENEDAESMEPMKDKETTFIGVSPDGMEYQFAFKKDTEGKFTICVCNIPDMGIEVEGTRVK